MARIRTIKPDFFTSLTIADLTYEARLTFIGLWTHVDDQGRCVDDARLVKAAVWPLDERTAKDVDVDLWVLADVELIIRYTVGPKKFIAVRGWEEHQRISHPSKAKLPAPEEGEATPKGMSVPEVLRKAPEDLQRIPGGLTEGSSDGSEGTPEGSSRVPVSHEMSDSGESGANEEFPYPGAVVLPLFTSENVPSGNPPEGSVNPHGGLPVGKERKGTGKGKETTSPRSARMGDSEALEADFKKWYSGYPNKQEPGAARTAYTKARKKATAQELLDGLERYKTLDPKHARGFTKYPATWLNKECWLNEYEPTPATAASKSLSGARGQIATAEQIASGLEFRL